MKKKEAKNSFGIGDSATPKDLAWSSSSILMPATSHNLVANPDITRYDSIFYYPARVFTAK